MNERTQRGPIYRLGEPQAKMAIWDLEAFMLAFERWAVKVQSR